MPRTTLQRRLNGCSFRAEQLANFHKLTQNEEESIVQLILSLDQHGAAPRHAHIRENADILLSKRGEATTTTVGEKWVYYFVKRHDQPKSRFYRRYNHQRAKCGDPKIIKEWFDWV